MIFTRFVLFVSLLLTKNIVDNENVAGIIKHVVSGFDFEGMLIFCSESLKHF